VSLVATATDACSATVTITNSRNGNGADASGSYPVGTTAVSFTAKDAAGNMSTCTAQVTVKDSTPPSLTCPSPAPAECAGPAGTAVSLVASASDLCSPPVQVTNTHGPGGADASGAYPLGTTPVTFTGNDAAGNTAICTAQATVVDTHAPTLALPSTLSVDATLPAGVVVTYQATASDTCAGPITPACAPPSGNLFRINPPGRSTTVTCTAADVQGNKATGTFLVHVAGAEEQIKKLSAVVAMMHLPKLVTGALQAELREALHELDEREPRGACGGMKAFLETVRIWSNLKPPRLTPGQEAALRDAASRIRGVLECGGQRGGQRTGTRTE
jgi:hypothetical protein